MRIKRKYRTLIAIVLTFQIVFMSISPVYAWKPKTHVFSANLILEELAENNGYLVFPYFGKIKVPDSYLSAIRTYPDYFRAGSVGPDAFPDIYVGQVFAHPKTKLAAGDWIKYLMDQVNKMPANSDERKRVLAFTLGYTVHASGDLFGHSYINRWAQGAWPNVSDEDGISNDDMKIIVRHSAVEEYIEKQIPSKFNTANYNAITIPQQFIYDNFVTNGKAADYDNVSSDKLDVSPIYSRTGAIPKHFEMFYDIRNKLKAGISSRASYNPVRIYQEYWLEDIDEGLRAWVDTSEKIAQDLLLPQDGLSKAKDHLSEWATHHFLSMVGFPDIVGGAIGVIGSISDIIEEIIPDFFDKIIKEMKNAFYDVIFQWAFDMKYTQLEAIMKDPARYLDDPNYFPAGSQVKLQSEINGFSSIRTSSGISLKPFQNTILMAKLNLVGQQGMDEILRLANMEYVGSTIYPPICFIKSLDVGYDWNDISFEGLSIWDDHRAREAVFNNIFSAETSKYKWFSKNERIIVDAYDNIMSADPDPDNMHFYAEQMKLGWKKVDVENDLRQRIANLAWLDDYRKETEILEEKINQDTVIERLNAGKPRAVYKSLNLNGKKLTVNCDLEIDRMGSINLNGGTLIVNGNFTIKEKGLMIGDIRQGGTLFVSGGSVIVHGNLIFMGGIVDVDSGTINVDRSFEHYGGLMNVNGGKVNVSGNYGLAVMNLTYQGSTGTYATNYNYSSGVSVLQMNNDKDHVTVGGNFITTSSVSHGKYLTAGILEIKGDFYQASHVYGCRVSNGIADLEIDDAAKSKENDKTNFKASGSHKVLLSGDKIQNVGMVVTSLSESQFNVLEITNNTEVKFVTKVTVANLFNHNNKKFTLTDAQGSTFPDYDGDGQKDDVDTTPCPIEQNIIINPEVPSMDNKEMFNPRIPKGNELFKYPHMPGFPEDTGSDPSVVLKDPLFKDNGVTIGNSDILGKDNAVTKPGTPVYKVTAILKGISGKDGVTLQWNDIKTQNTMGYYIYRGIKSGEHDIKPLNSIPTSKTEYIDTTVKAGGTYYYAITIFNWDGSETEALAEISVIVPIIRRY